MPEVVKRARLPNRGHDSRQPNPPTEVGAANMTTSRCTEEKPRSVSMYCKVFRQLVDDKRRHRHGATRRVRLGRLDQELATHLGQAFLDSDGPAQGVEVVSAKGCKFTKPQARVSSSQNHCSIPLVDYTSKRLGLCRLKNSHR